MRILQISSAKTYGGGERHFVDLCRGLQERGHEVFAAVRPTNQWQSRLDFLPPENMLHVSIRNSIGVFSAMRMAEYVRDNKIAIIHAHVARDYIPASIACLAAKDSKFVLTRHLVFPLKPFNRFALKNLSCAIGVSEAVGVELSHVFPREKVRVIPNGIDLSEFACGEMQTAGGGFRELHSIPRNAPLVGTLGELKSLKGQTDFVLAAQEVLKEVPECRFVVVGKDNTLEKSYRRDLKRLVSVCEMDDKFLWLDWLDDTTPFYAALDVFVSPSHSESFGLAILEAMLRGKAIVATATDGARELFGVLGELVETNDPVAMARVITDLLKDQTARDDLGRKLQARAGENYSLVRMIDSVEALYREIETR